MSLLMLRLYAYYHYLALALDDLALVAHGLNRRSDFHCNTSISRFGSFRTVKTLRIFTITRTLLILILQLPHREIASRFHYHADVAYLNFAASAP